MLRTVNAQPTLWESILPAAVLGMPAELEAVDRRLDDPRFFEPYRVLVHESLGWPSIPIETYLRLMFLKFRYKLGFEPLCRDSSRFDHLAAVLSYPARWCGTTSDDVDEDHDPLR